MYYAIILLLYLVVPIPYLNTHIPCGSASPVFPGAPGSPAAPFFPLNPLLLLLLLPEGPLGPDGQLQPLEFVCLFATPWIAIVLPWLILVSDY